MWRTTHWWEMFLLIPLLVMIPLAVGAQVHEKTSAFLKIQASAIFLYAVSAVVFILVCADGASLTISVALYHVTVILLTLSVGLVCQQYVVRVQIILAHSKMHGQYLKTIQITKWVIIIFNAAVVICSLVVIVEMALITGSSYDAVDRPLVRVTSTMVRVLIGLFQGVCLFSCSLMLFQVRRYIMHNNSGPKAHVYDKSQQKYHTHMWNNAILAIALGFLCLGYQLYMAIIRYTGAANLFPGFWSRILEEFLYSVVLFGCVWSRKKFDRTYLLRCTRIRPCQFHRTLQKLHQQLPESCQADVFPHATRHRNRQRPRQGMRRGRRNVPALAAEALQRQKLKQERNRLRANQRQYKLPSAPKVGPQPRPDEAPAKRKKKQQQPTTYAEQQPQANSAQPNRVEISVDDQAARMQHTNEPTTTVPMETFQIVSSLRI
jgi:hypothetical protein